VLRGSVVACLAAMVVVPAAAATAPQKNDALVLELSPAEIGLFYNGVQLTVSCDVDAGLALAVVVSGKASDLHLRRQARVWRTFWAPVGEVSFARIPAVYLLRTSVPLGTLAPDSTLRALGIGYESLRPTAPAEATRDLFPDLVRLKESEGLFHASSGGIEVTAATGGRGQFTTTIALGAKAPPGEYRVQVFGFRAGEVTLHEEGVFVLSQGSFNAFATSLGLRHGLLYGILAVVVAAGAGLLVGLMFGSVKVH
jgi:Putative transmembrane protein (Alph_Pro_TM)